MYKKEETVGKSSASTNSNGKSSAKGQSSTYVPQTVKKRSPQYIKVNSAKASQGYSNGLTIARKNSSGGYNLYQKDNNPVGSYGKSAGSDTKDKVIKSNARYNYAITDQGDLDYTQLAAYGRNNFWSAKEFQSLADAVNNRGSKFYNPYFKGAMVQNKAADYLREYFGYDGDFDEDFFVRTSDIQNYLISDSNTTLNASTPSSKTGTPEQWAAYYWVQLQDDMETQTKVNTEWSEMRTNAATWFQNQEFITGKKPSYQDFINAIDMSKYPTLQKIDDSRNIDYSTSQALVQLNTGTYYSKESLAGLYYTLTNGGDLSEDRDYTEDAILYWMGEYEEPAQNYLQQTYGLDTTDYTDDTYAELMDTAWENGDHELYEALKAARYQASDTMDSIDKTDYLGERFGYYRDDAWFDAVEKHYASTWDRMRDEYGEVQKPKSSEDEVLQAAWQAWEICQMKEDTDTVDAQAQAVFDNITSTYALLAEQGKLPSTQEEFKQQLIDSRQIPSENNDDYEELKKYMSGDLKTARTVFISDEEIDAYIERVWKGNLQGSSQPDSVTNETVSPSPSTESIPQEAEVSATSTPKPIIIEPEESEAPLYLEYDIQNKGVQDALKRTSDASKLGESLLALAASKANVSAAQWMDSNISISPVSIDDESNFNSTVAALWYANRSDEYTKEFGRNVSSETCVASDPVLKALCSVPNVDLTQTVTSLDVLDMLKQQTLAYMGKSELTIADGAIQAIIPSANELMTELGDLSLRYDNNTAGNLLSRPFDVKAYNSAYNLAKDAGYSSNRAVQLALDSIMFAKPGIDDLGVGVEADEELSAGAKSVADKVIQSDAYINAVDAASGIAQGVINSCADKGALSDEISANIGQFTSNLVIGLSEAATPSLSAATKDITNDILHGDISSQDIADGVQFYSNHAVQNSTVFSSFAEGEDNATADTTLIDETATPYGNLIVGGSVNGQGVMMMNKTYWIRMLEQDPERAAELNKKYNSNIKKYYDDTDMPALIASAAAQYGHDDTIYQADTKQIKQNEGIANKLDDTEVKNRFDYWFGVLIHDDSSLQTKYNSERTQLYYTLNNYSNYFTPEEALAISAAWGTGYLSYEGAQAVINARVNSMSSYTANYINNQSDTQESEEKAESFFNDNRELSRQLQAANASDASGALYSKARVAQENFSMSQNAYQAVKDAGLADVIGVSENDDEAIILNKLSEILSGDSSTILGENANKVAYSDDQLETLEKMYNAVNDFGALGFDLVAYGTSDMWKMLGVDFDSVGLTQTPLEYMDEITDYSWREAFGNEGMEFIGTGGSDVVSNTVYQTLQSVGNVPALLSRQFRDLFDFVPGIDAYEAGDGSYYDRVKAASDLTGDEMTNKGTQGQQFVSSVGKTVGSFFLTKGIGKLFSTAPATKAVEALKQVGNYQETIVQASSVAASTVQGIGSGSMLSNLANSIDDVVAAGVTAIRGIDAQQIASMMPRLLTTEANAYESNRNAGKTVASSFIRAATETVLEGAWMSSAMQHNVSGLNAAVQSYLNSTYSEVLQPYLRKATYPVIDFAARTASTFAGRVVIENAQQIADSLYDAADLMDTQSASDKAYAAMTGTEMSKQGTVSQYFKALFEVIADPETSEEWRERLASAAWVSIISGISVIPDYIKKKPKTYDLMLRNSEDPTDEETVDFIKTAVDDMDAYASVSSTGEAGSSNQTSDVAIAGNLPKGGSTKIGMTGSADASIPYGSSGANYNPAIDTPSFSRGWRASSADNKQETSSKDKNEVATVTEPADAARQQTELQSTKTGTALSQSPSDVMTDLIKKVIRGEATNDEIQQTVAGINTQLTGSVLQPTAQSVTDKIAHDSALQSSQSKAETQPEEEKQSSSEQGSAAPAPDMQSELPSDRAARISQEAENDPVLSGGAKKVAEFMTQADTERSTIVAQEVATQEKERLLGENTAIKSAEEAVVAAQEAVKKASTYVQQKQSKIAEFNERIHLALAAADDPSIPGVQNTVVSLAQQVSAMKVQLDDYLQKLQEAEEELSKKEKALQEVRSQAETDIQTKTDAKMIKAREKYENAKQILELGRNELRGITMEINATKRNIEQMRSLYGDSYIGLLAEQKRLDALESTRIQKWLEFKNVYGNQALWTMFFTPEDVKNYRSLASQKAEMERAKQMSSKAVAPFITRDDATLDRITDPNLYQGKAEIVPDDPNRKKKPYEVENAKNSEDIRQKNESPTGMLNYASQQQLGTHDATSLVTYDGTDPRTQIDKVQQEKPYTEYGGMANEKERLEREAERTQQQKWEGKVSAADLLDVVDPRNPAVTGVDPLAIDEDFEIGVLSLGQQILTTAKSSEKNFWDFAIQVPAATWRDLKSLFAKVEGGDAYTGIFFREKVKSDEDIQTGLRWIDREKVEKGGKDGTKEYQEQNTPLNMEALNALGLAPVYVLDGGRAFILTTVEHTNQQFQADELQMVQRSREVQAIREEMDGYKQQIADVKRQINLIDGKLLNLPANTEANASQRKILFAQKEELNDKINWLRFYIDSLQDDYKEECEKLGLFGAEWFFVARDDVETVLKKIEAASDRNKTAAEIQEAKIKGKQSERYTLANGDTVYLPTSDDPADYAELDDEQLREIMVRMYVNDSKLQTIVKNLSIEELHSWLHSRLPKAGRIQLHKFMSANTDWLAADFEQTYKYSQSEFRDALQEQLFDVLRQEREGIADAMTREELITAIADRQEDEIKKFAETAYAVYDLKHLQDILIANTKFDEMNEADRQRTVGNIRHMPRSALIKDIISEWETQSNAESIATLFGDLPYVKFDGYKPQKDKNGQMIPGNYVSEFIKENGGRLSANGQWDYVQPSAAYYIHQSLLAFINRYRNMIRKSNTLAAMADIVQGIESTKTDAQKEQDKINQNRIKALLLKFYDSELNGGKTLGVLTRGEFKELTALLDATSTQQNDLRTSAADSAFKNRTQYLDAEGVAANTRSVPSVEQRWEDSKIDTRIKELTTTLKEAVALSQKFPMMDFKNFFSDKEEVELTYLLLMRSSRFAEEKNRLTPLEASMALNMPKPAQRFSSFGIRNNDPAKEANLKKQAETNDRQAIDLAAIKGFVDMAEQAKSRMQQSKGEWHDKDEHYALQNAQKQEKIEDEKQAAREQAQANGEQKEKKKKEEFVPPEGFVLSEVQYGYPFVEQDNDGRIAVDTIAEGTLFVNPNMAQPALMDETGHFSMDKAMEFFDEALVKCRAVWKRDSNGRKVANEWDVKITAPNEDGQLIRRRVGVYYSATEIYYNPETRESISNEAGDYYLPLREEILQPGNIIVVTRYGKGKENNLNFSIRVESGIKTDSLVKSLDLVERQFRALFAGKEGQYSEDDFRKYATGYLRAKARLLNRELDETLRDYRLHGNGFGEEHLAALAQEVKNKQLELKKIETALASPNMLDQYIAGYKLNGAGLTSDSVRAVAQKLPASSKRENLKAQAIAELLGSKTETSKASADVAPQTQQNETQQGGTQQSANDVPETAEIKVTQKKLFTNACRSAENKLKKPEKHFPTKEAVIAERERLLGLGGADVATKGENKTLQKLNLLLDEFETEGMTPEQKIQYYIKRAEEAQTTDASNYRYQRYQELAEAAFAAHNGSSDDAEETATSAETSSPALAESNELTPVSGEATAEPSIPDAVPEVISTAATQTENVSLATSPTEAVKPVSKAQTEKPKNKQPSKKNAKPVPKETGTKKTPSKKSPDEKLPEKKPPTDETHIMLGGKIIDRNDATPEQIAQAFFNDLQLSPAVEAQMDRFYPRRRSVESKSDAVYPTGTKFDTNVEDLTWLGDEAGIEKGRSILRTQKNIINNLTSTIDSLATEAQTLWKLGANRWATAKKEMELLRNQQKETKQGTPEYASIVAQINAIRTYQVNAENDRENYEQWAKLMENKKTATMQRDVGKKVYRGNVQKVNGSKLAKQIAEGKIEYNPHSPIPGAKGNKSGLEIAREIGEALYNGDSIQMPYGKHSAISVSDVADMLKDKFDHSFFDGILTDAHIIAEGRRDCERTVAVDTFKLALTKAYLSAEKIDSSQLQSIINDATEELIMAFQSSVSRHDYSEESYNDFRNALAKARDDASYMSSKIDRDFYSKYGNLVNKPKEITDTLSMTDARQSLLESANALAEEIALNQEYVNNMRSIERAYHHLGKGNVLGSLESLDGGQIPVPLMNIFLGMLYDAASEKSNKPGFISEFFDSPERNIERFAGKYAPIFHAVFVRPAIVGNNKQRGEYGEIMKKLESVLPDRKITIKMPEGKQEMSFREIVGHVIEDRRSEAYADVSEKEYITKWLYDHEVPIENGDRTAIREAVDYCRKFNDLLYQRANDVLTRHGHFGQTYGYRKWYMHHYNNDGDNGILAKFGIHTGEEAIPDALTEDTSEWRPSHGFNAASLERQGTETGFDFLESVKRSLNGVLSTIHQTGNIDRLKQLEQAILGTPQRDEKGNFLYDHNKIVFQDRTPMFEVAADGTIVNKSQLIKAANEVGRFSQRAANKRTGQIDRAVEKTLGRNAIGWLRFAVSLRSMASTAFNPISAITNLAPIKFLMGIVSPNEFNSAVASTICCLRNDEIKDDFVSVTSTFLKGRSAYSPEERSIQGKLADKGYWLANAADTFAANIIVRALFNHGMRIYDGDQSRALAQAEDIARKILTDKSKVGRSRFYENNLLGGFFGQFKQESVNELMYMTKDMFSYTGGDSSGGAKFAKFMLAMLAVLTYNALHNFLSGSDTMTDLFGTGVKTVNEIKNDDDGTWVDKAKTVAGNVASSVLPIDSLSLGDTATGSALEDIIEQAELLLEGEEDIWGFIATLGSKVFMGGSTAYRSYKGVKEVLQGYSETSGGRVKYDTGDFNIIKLLASAIGGTGVLPESKAYTYGFESALSTSESDTFRALVDDADIDPTTALRVMQGTGDAKSLSNGARQLANDENANATDILDARSAASEARNDIEFPSDMAVWAAKSYAQKENSAVRTGVEAWKLLGNDVQNLTYPTELGVSEKDGYSKDTLDAMETTYMLNYNRCIEDYKRGLYGEVGSVPAAKQLAHAVSKIKSYILNRYKPEEEVENNG